MKENSPSQSSIFNRRTITRLVVYRLVRVLSLLAVVGFLSSRADAQFLYVNNNGSPNVISAFHFNSAGTLTPVPGAPFPTGGNGGVCVNIGTTRTIHPSGGRLYATNSGSGNVSGFNIANDGSLTPVPGSPFPMSPGGSIPTGVAASANGGFLFVGRGFSGAGIDVFQINADGSLTLVPGSPFGVGGGAGYDVLFDARRKNVISDVAFNEVSVFSAAKTGALVPIPGSPFTTPTVNNHKMALGSQGSCLFVAGGGDPRVSAMQVARDGSLSNAPGSPVAATGQSVVIGAATTQQGNFAYFGGDSGVSGFSFDNRCSLSPIPGSPFLSGGPNSFGVTTEGSGKFLFAVNIVVGGSVSSFKIASNGSLTLIGTSPLQGTAFCPTGLAAYPVIVGPPASR